MTSHTPEPAVDISLVVIAYDMERELPRTLHSLSRTYQRDIDKLNYEVIVVDNGSATPVSQDLVEGFGAEFKLIRAQRPSPSPASAVNIAAQAAKGINLGVIVDGARLLSPGVLSGAYSAFCRNEATLVSIIGLHLGSEVQSLAVTRGYDAQVEDQLLRKIQWPRDGYQLFEISCLGGSSRYGWSGPMAESNCLILPSVAFEEMGGFDERFTSPGGGLVNLDFYKRVSESGLLQNVSLLGEACFHQLHGGITTGGKNRAVKKFDQMQNEYQEIRGELFVPPKITPSLIGDLHPAAKNIMQQGFEQFQKDHPTGPL